MPFDRSAQFYIDDLLNLQLLKEIFEIYENQRCTKIFPYRRTNFLPFSSRSREKLAVK